MTNPVALLEELREAARAIGQHDQEAALTAAIALMRAPVGGGYYLASFKHKDNGAVLWWGPGDAGYTPDLATAGVYTELTHGYHDSEYTVPVPVGFIKGLRVRQVIDTGDSLNRAFWSPTALREAIAAMQQTTAEGDAK